MIVFLGVLFSEWWKFLGDGVEKINNDIYWDSFYVGVEFFNGNWIWYVVVVVELDFFLDGKKDGSEYEDGWLVF